jgi:heptosyltransferase-1
MSTPPPSNILIIRLSALGDVVMASGLIPALRQRFPGARLSWLVEPAAEPLLRHNPRLDEVIVLPRPEWKQLWRGRRRGEALGRMRAFRKELRGRGFDLAIDAQGLLKSAVWAWLSGARRRIGIISREGSRLLMTERVVPPSEETPAMGAEYRFLAERLGAPEGSFRHDLALGAEPRRAAREALRGAGVAGDFVALCPFTTRPQKHWAEARWAELGGVFLARGLAPVLLGGPGDAGAARRLAAGAPGMANLAGKLKLDETAAAVAMSRLVVGVDTGLTHMGSALGVPVVALFGSTRPYLRAASPLTKVLYTALACSPCHRRPSCGGRFECMGLHTVEAVARQAEIQLGMAR